jgi:hypothetical protein
MSNKPLLFDIWWIDPVEDLKIVIKLSPHLPPQHTAILKWINHSITKNDIKDELGSKYESVFSIEEMIEHLI